MENNLYRDDRGHTAILTLNHPTVNALNRNLVERLHDEVDRLSLDSDIRSVIITGAGTQAFCAGADLKERKTLSQREVSHFVQSIRSLFSKIDNLHQPTIAAINGTALGGGLELALACDLRLVAQNTQLGLPETRLAIIPGAGGTQRLPRIIGFSRAKEMILTGKKIRTDQALDWGLANAVLAHDEVLSSALEWAEQINEGGPLALQQAKVAINYGWNSDLATGLALETKAYETLIPTKDRLEALQAFAEKRNPNFRGE